MRILTNTRIWGTIFLAITTYLFSFSAYAKYSGGTGEPNDPYQISTAEDLMLLGESSEDYDKHFILIADINLDPNLPGRKVFRKALIAPDTNDTKWGFDGTNFTGVFDGNGHTILRLTISGEDFLGLFGRIDSETQISNLGLEAVDVNGTGYHVGGLVGTNLEGGNIISCYCTGFVTGYSDVGGLTGENRGHISDCHSMAEVICNGYGNAGGLLGLNSHTGIVVHSYSTGNVSSREHAGGFIGSNSGFVDSCYSTGEVVLMGSWGISVSGGLVAINEDGIRNCYSTSNVSGGDNVGGLVGRNEYGYVINCRSSGTVTGEYYVGGLVGILWGSTIINCFSNSEVTGNYGVGGLLGVNGAAYVCNCYSTGQVQGVTYVGGLIGDNGFNGRVINCYSIGSVGGDKSVGGLVGKSDHDEAVMNSFWNISTSGQLESAGGGIGLEITNMHDILTYLDAGWDFVGESQNGMHQIWQMPAEANYPVIAILNGYTQPQLQGLGTIENPYLISEAQELGAIIYYNPDLCYKLTNDIDLVGINWSMAIIPIFHGSFDGNGFVIKNLRIDGMRDLGLFGELCGGAPGKVIQVKNLGLIDVSVHGKWDEVGILAGYNSGDIRSCYCTGMAIGNRRVGGLFGFNCGRLIDSYSWASVEGLNYVGGIAGLNTSSIDNCYNTGSVSGQGTIGGLVGCNEDGSVNSCYSTGKVSGNSYIGGLVGDNSYGSVNQCYSGGDISGGFFVGGLVGLNADWNVEGIVNQSFWDTETSGLTNMCGSQADESSVCDDSYGKTTAEMQTAGTFLDAGWDFSDETANGKEDIWWIIEGQDYPRLWWELIPEN